jgi:hypothetical protein
VSRARAIVPPFYRGSTFPEPYRSGAFIGQRGSWNRSAFAGYKVLFVPFKADGSLLMADDPGGTVRRVSALHVQYGYAYGSRARLLGQAYLTTRGRDKVGFTVVGTADNGGPEYIGGLRGAVERNAMRLYLAIDAYLDALDEAGERRRERSLRAWLDAIARYPRQLAEADPVAYFEAKRRRL